VAVGDIDYRIGRRDNSRRAGGPVAVVKRDGSGGGCVLLQAASAAKQERQNGAHEILQKRRDLSPYALSLANDGPVMDAGGPEKPWLICRPKGRFTKAAQKN